MATKILGKRKRSISEPKKKGTGTKVVSAGRIKRRSVRAETSDYYPLSVQNYVCTASLMQKVDVRQVAEFLRGRYDRSRFPSCVLRLLSPRVTINVFGTGKIVVSGAKHPVEAITAMHLVATRLSRLFCRRVCVGDFGVENVVHSAGLGFSLDLNRFYNDHMATCDYAPETFVQARYNPRDHIVVIMPTSGKVVVTGARTEKEAHDVFQSIPFSKYALDPDAPNLVPENNRRQRYTETKARK